MYILFETVSDDDSNSIVSASVQVDLTNKLTRNE